MPLQPKMKMNNPPKQTISILAEKFNTAQKSNLHLRSALINISEIVESNSELYACEQGLQCLMERFLLAPVKKDAGVARVQEVLATLLLPSVLFQEDSCSNQAFIFLEEVLKYSKAADKGVRLQVCRLVCSVMSAVAGMTEGDGEISEKAWNLLRSHLLPRLRDKQVAVRATAARAFEFLQGDMNDSSSSDSDDNESEGGNRDEATLELLRLASGDASKEVRVAATKSFQLSPITLTALINQTRDSSHEVRIAAIDRIGTKVNLIKLTRDVRVSILSRTLSDRNKDVVVKAKWLFLDCWLRRLNFNCPKFFDLISSPDPLSPDPSRLCASLILQTVYPSHDAQFNREDVKSIEASLALHASKMRNATRILLDENELSAGDVLLLRLRAERATQLGGALKEDELDDILPQMVAFSGLADQCVKDSSDATAARDDAIAELSEVTSEGLSPASPLFAAASESAEHATKIADKKQTLALEMLRLLPLLDQQDEIGRLTMITTLRDAVLSGDTSDELVEEAVSTIAQLCSSGELVDLLHSVILESSLKVSSSEASEQGWWEYRQSIAIAEALKHLTLGTSVGAEVEVSLMALVGNAESATRERAVQGLGRLCLLGEHSSMKFHPVLLNIAVAVDTEAICVRGSAVQALIDIMMMYDSVGLLLREDAASLVARAQLPAAASWLSGLKNDSCVAVELLCWLMQSEMPMAALAAEGTSKLIMNLKIGESSEYVAELLNALVALFFTTESEESGDLVLGSTGRMQQVLTMFFKLYPPITSYATLRLSFSKLIGAALEEDTRFQQCFTSSSAVLLFSDMFQDYELVCKENKQSDAYVALEICRALRSSSSTATWAKNARKDLTKVFGVLEVPCVDDKGKATDVQLLKLVALWTEQTASHLSALDGIASAKHIRKFAQSCKEHDPIPAEMLPSELVLSLATDHLHLTENNPVALLLSDTPISAAASTVRPSRRLKASTAVGANEFNDNSEEDDQPCVICLRNGDDDKAVICDGCEGVFHVYCLNPPLVEIPDGDWFCGGCGENKTPIPKKKSPQKFETKVEKLVTNCSQCQPRSVLKDINS